ncbi:UNVERIFIED_CONTAM: hypothetical protein Slati_3597500 [Sesamum latifolium]|uniref:Uncharacterized protein n=1 Tax=Sesamum latifolium TaxID=2727402 RepID=A0AAW2TZU4_9LAMI
MEEAAGMDFDDDAPLVQAFKRKRKAIPKKKEQQVRTDKPPDAPRNPESVQLPADAEHLTTNAPPEIVVSEFDYSVENHIKAVNTIVKLCGYPETLDVNQPEVKRLSNSITFLREWRDFKYTPRIVRFAYQHNSKEKDVIGGVTLSQFSAASVPKKETQNGSEAATESIIKDFIMHVGGAVWALDWCPRVHRNTENHIKSEFVAVAAHPPESSYHKIGAPLTGRGVVQIWCLLTVSMTEAVSSQRNKRSRQISKKKEPVKGNEPTKAKRPRGRPRKKPLDESVEKIDTHSENVQPLAMEYPAGRPTLHSSDTVGNASKHVYDEDSVRTHKDSNCLDHPNALMLAGPKGRGKAKAQREDQVHNNGLHVLRQCEHGESTLVNQPACAGADKNITCNDSCDPSTSKISIPLDVALPRMMLCLAHNGKVVWDLKWQPVNASDPESMKIMGYLAVLLGNGALEVWEVPLPHTVTLVYPACQERIDPRFIKLRPVFRCSMLKCGDRQSIPLTLEWCVSSPHDMILAGCHDGVVALWKFSVTDPLTETRPLLSFSADTGPVRSLAWAPVQGELESANVIITAGPKGFKFWDIRDPFRPLWDHHIPGVTYGLEWLPDPRCVFGSIEDGTLWLLSLERAAHDIPVTGKSITAPKHGFHSFDCSSFSIWCIHASRLTGMVAYCGEEGTTFCFQPTTRSVRDPSRNRLHHYLCGSLSEEGTALIVASPSTNSLLQKRSPGMKRSGGAKDQEKRVKEQMAKSLTCNEPPTPAICWSDHVEEHGSDNSSVVIKKQAAKPKQSSKTQSQANQEIVLCRSYDAGQLQGEGSGKEEKGDGFEVFPPKIVAMHRVRWNVNKGREKWLCYGGAAGLLRCQEVDFSVLN